LKLLPQSLIEQKIDLDNAGNKEEVMTTKIVWVLGDQLWVEPIFLVTSHKHEQQSSSNFYPGRFTTPKNCLTTYQKTGAGFGQLCVIEELRVCGWSVTFSNSRLHNTAIMVGWAKPDYRVASPYFPTDPCLS